jgi:hypothetical protein
MLNLSPESEVDLKLTGADVINIITALGEIPHKFAASIERKIVDQVMTQKRPSLDQVS